VVSVFLLDVNVLLALAWPRHAAHRTASDWFARNSERGWATCPLTESGFVRIISNPAFSPAGPNPNQAARILEANCRHPAHKFWPADLSWRETATLFGSRIIGHRQVSDAYLLALAIHRGGSLATLDRAVPALLPAGSRHAASIELIS
jgi:toxin-antitoxin system PIN domain toxin